LVDDDDEEEDEADEAECECEEVVEGDDSNLVRA